MQGVYTPEYLKRHPNAPPVVQWTGGVVVRKELADKVTNGASSAQAGMCSAALFDARPSHSIFRHLVQPRRLETLDSVRLYIHILSLFYAAGPKPQSSSMAAAWRAPLPLTQGVSCSGRSVASACTSPSGVQCRRWFPASSASASSAWWLSISASFTTTSSGFFALSASKMLPAPAWLREAA